MKKIFLISLCIVSISAYSQSMRSISYATGAPISSYRDFISEYSWKGVEFGYQHKWGDNLTYGFHYRYLNFYEKKDRATYEFENGAITTTVYTYSFINNFNLSINYFHFNDSRITPYVGLASGPAFVRNKLIVGFIDIEENAMRFSISPQVGTMIELTEGTEVDIKVNYNYIPLQYENFKSMHFIGISVGVTWSNLYD